MNGSNRVEVEGLVKRWGSEAAVDGLDFAVERGEFLVVLGPSGCGKSTALRLIAGLEPLTAGSVRIDGADVSDRSPAHRKLSMVFQSYALFPHLDVAENIVFGLKSRRVVRGERERRLAETARIVGLESMLHRRPGQLSGGQRQRVALARAIISENPICLMDEPLSNLDARLRGEMRREIRSLQQRLGMTVIYVTHDQVEAMSMGDRVLLMNAGRRVQMGPPESLYERPADTFAAAFIGSPPMNVMPLVAVTGGATVPGLEPEPLAPAALAGGQFGVRPESIAVDDADRPGLPARVVGAEYLGADTLIRACLGDQTLLARIPGRRNAREGETVTLSWPAEASHLFDDNGQRRDDCPGIAAGMDPDWSGAPRRNDRHLSTTGGNRP